MVMCRTFLSQMNEGFMGLLSRPGLKSGGNDLRRQQSGTLNILSNYAQSVLATAHSQEIKFW